MTSSWCLDDCAEGLVHPSRFRSAILFSIVVRGDVIAVLVEGHSAVMIAHIDFKLAGSAATLPAIIRVAESKILLRDCCRLPPRKEQRVPDVTCAKAGQ